MATHSSVLAWRIPGTGEPGGLLSMGSHRVGHDWNELAAAVVRVIRLAIFCDYGFSVSALWCPLTTPTSYLGFSYLGCRVSLHGCSSKAQLLLLTLDEGYLLMASPPDLKGGVAPLCPSAPTQSPLLGCRVAPLAASPDLGRTVAHQDSTHRHHQMVNTEIRLIIFFVAKNGEALYSQQKQDWELTVAQIMNSLLPNS